jgi:hypothetical protein
MKRWWCESLLGYKGLFVRANTCFCWVICYSNFDILLTNNPQVELRLSDIRAYSNLRNFTDEANVSTGARNYVRRDVQ